jgi:hypothetical protein
MYPQLATRHLRFAALWFNGRRPGIAVGDHHGQEEFKGNSIYHLHGRNG